MVNITQNEMYFILFFLFFIKKAKLDITNKKPKSMSIGFGLKILCVVNNLNSMVLVKHVTINIINNGKDLKKEIYFSLKKAIIFSFFIFFLLLSTIFLFMNFLLSFVMIIAFFLLFSNFSFLFVLFVFMCYIICGEFL